MTVHAFHQQGFTLSSTWLTMYVPQVRGAHQELRSKGAEVEEMVAAAEVKDADNTRLWDQVPIPRPLCCLYRCCLFPYFSIQAYRST